MTRRYFNGVKVKWGIGGWGGGGGWDYCTSLSTQCLGHQVWHGTRNAERGTKNDITIPQDSTVCGCHRFRLFFFLLSPPPLQRVGETVITAHSQVCLGEAPFPPPSSVRCGTATVYFRSQAEGGRRLAVVVLLLLLGFWFAE